MLVRSVSRLLAAVVLLGCLLPCEAAEFVQRIVKSLTIPEGRYQIVPYASETGAWFHLQPKGRGQELLIDARSAQVLSQAPVDFANAKRLSFLGAEELSVPQNRDRVAYLRALGCAQFNQGCTVLDDDSTLLLLNFSANSFTLNWEFIDTRPLLHAAWEVFAARKAATAKQFSELEQSILDYAVARTDFRNEIYEAMAGIDSLDKLERFQESRRVLSLCNWTSFTCSERAGPVMDLRRAEEQQLIRTYAQLLAQQYLGKKSQEARLSLVQFLLRITAPPFPAGDSASFALDEFRKFSDADRNAMAQALRVYEGPESATIWCFAAWIRQESCSSPRASEPVTVAAAPVAVLPSPGSDPTKAPSRPSSGQPRPVASPSASPVPANQAAATSPASPNVPLVVPSAAVVPTAIASIPEEWNSILSFPDKAKLLSLDERNGLLVRDNSSIGGVVFTAKSLGKVSDGRFEIVAKAAAGTSVPIRVGRYRVKVSLTLNYLREDSCASNFVKCIFTSNNRVSKSESREAVFVLSPENRWQELKNLSFGHLLPLTADGGALYKSELREVRLAVKNVIWALY